MNVMNPTSAVPELLAGEWAIIVAPGYAMRHDLAMWNTTSAGYTLPYPTLTGNATSTRSTSTCRTSLDLQRRLHTGGLRYDLPRRLPAGLLGRDGAVRHPSNNPPQTHHPRRPARATGEDRLTTIAATDQDGRLQVRGGRETREIDLQNAAKSGQAMAIDLPGTNLYDIADRNSWLNTNRSSPTYPGVSLYGTYPFYGSPVRPVRYERDSSLTGHTTSSSHSLTSGSDRRSPTRST